MASLNFNLPPLPEIPMGARARVRFEVIMWQIAVMTGVLTALGGFVVSSTAPTDPGAAIAASVGVGILAGVLTRYKMLLRWLDEDDDKTRNYHQALNDARATGRREVITRLQELSREDGGWHVVASPEAGVITSVSLIVGARSTSSTANAPASTVESSPPSPKEPK